jgi:prepilin peptidase CpaA
MMVSTVAAYVGSICFSAATIWAALMDLTTMRIRNEISLFLLGTYATMAPLVGLSVAEIGWSVAVALAVLALMFVSFAFGWIGGGDAKLASVIALWIGANQTLNYLAYTAIFGGVLTLLILQFRSMVLPYQLIRMQWIARLHASTCGVPYGVAIAAGAVFAFPETPWMAALR